MRGKFTSFANRCKTQTGYKGLSYLSLPEYISFCNSNKRVVSEIWNKYTESGRQLSLSLSIDRIDSNKGYEVNNMQFVTVGYNAYKSNINPCRVIHKNKKYYFMSAEEGSRYFGIRRQDIGECIRKVKYHNKDFAAKSVDMDIVLKENNVDSLEEYYDKFINID